MTTCPIQEPSGLYGVQNAHLNANVPPQAPPQPQVSQSGPLYSQQGPVPRSEDHVPGATNPHEAISSSEGSLLWDSQEAARYSQGLLDNYYSHPHTEASSVPSFNQEKQQSDSQQSAKRVKISPVQTHYQPSPDFYSHLGAQPSADQTTSQLSRPPSVQQHPISFDRNHYGPLYNELSADNNATIGQVIPPHIYNQQTQPSAYQLGFEYTNPHSIPQQHPGIFQGDYGSSSNLHSANSASNLRSPVSVLNSSFPAETRHVNPASQLPPPPSASQVPLQPSESSFISSGRVNTSVSPFEPGSQQSENHYISRQNLNLPASTEAPAQQSGTNTAEMPSINLVVPFQVKGQKGDYTVNLSIPAKAKDIEGFRTEADRAQVTDYVTGSQEKDDRVVAWYNQVGNEYWNMIIDRFRDTIPRGVSEAEVHGELIKSHPCIRDPWTGHTIYKNLLGKKDKIPQLEAWMYGAVAVGNGSATLYATWWDTLRSKVNKKDKKVPWIPQARLVALWIILRRGNPDTVLSQRANSNRKWEQLKRCKLTHLLSDPESAAPDTFWDGFLLELEEDPQQDDLYEKVMAEGPVADPAEDQDAGPAEDQNTERLRRRIQQLENFITENDLEIPETEDDEPN